MKVSELDGAELDYWTAKAARDVLADTLLYTNGTIPERWIGFAREQCYIRDHGFFSPSAAWVDCGPLIERFKVDVFYGWQENSSTGAEVYEWEASIDPDCSGDALLDGHVSLDPKVAICRAIVASVYGEEVPAEKVSR